MNREDPSDPQEIIRVRDEYYIHANSTLADDRTSVLKQGETFAVFDRTGDVHPIGRGHQGLYHDGTRYLSRLELRVEGERPILLSSTLTEDNSTVVVDLTNPALGSPLEGAVAQDTIHLFRSAVLTNGGCYQRLRIRSFALRPIHFSISFLFAADFIDLFEVRGFERECSGTLLDTVLNVDSVTLSYRGLDRVVRATSLHFSPRPTRIDPGEARFSVYLPPGGEETFDLQIACDEAAAGGLGADYEQATAAVSRALESRTTEGFRVEATSAQFNDWLNRATADLRMMLTETRHGLYPYAGVPWFNAPFGRDGMITALETMWMDPSIAAAVLRYLAATQASEESTASEAEPGKILHEARGGELSNLGEVPFQNYYGAVDTTPLFVVLAHAHFDRTADLGLLREIWPNIVRALDWIDTYGDRDGDGFVEYERRSPTGLVNQGWKDSHDSVFHDDGRPAEGAIALCEVQAYVFGAKRGAAELAAALGEEHRARILRAEAAALQEKFEERFWSDQLATYVLALDGHKEACRVRSSNAGQCLFTGIASFDRARMVAETLMRDDFFSNWGIRTIPTSEKRYNPISYHNGSVWPHDNAIIAAGLSRYGLKEPVLRILSGFFDASRHLDLNRMPELFCGFSRRSGEGPTLYPVACAPQAWAAAAVYLLLQSSLGLKISARANQVLISNPMLPPFLDCVRIDGLRVGASTVDLHFQRHPHDVGVEVVEREGVVDVLVVK
ncbi:MAG: glycogen debranching N-terminal domain-containing protein [Myxococcota bacterium]